jgi:tetratricopeptide (TPR) repeat protein
MRRSESWFPGFPGLAGALALVALSVSVSARQGAPGSPTLNAYAAMVDRYRQGQIDAAIEDVTTRDRRWIEEALRLLERAEWPAVDLEAAALLHTEAAWDERAGGLGPAHLSAVEWIVNHGSWLPIEFRRRWYLLVTWHLQSDLRFEDLARHVDAMIKRFPADGEALLALGSLYEALGWSREPPIDLPRPERLVPRERGAPGDSYPAILMSLAGRGQRKIQEEAAEAFRRAVAVSPSLDEARLRLGRMMNELDRPDDALGLLKPLREGDATASLKYLAWLFVGAAEQRRNDLDAAISAYREAAAQYPACQTPVVALSNALRNKGERAAAMGVLLRAAVVGSQCDDPWWSYHFGQAWRFDSALRELRKDVAR